MTDRITRQDVETRVANLNRRMEQHGSLYRYAAEGRNGYIALDRLSQDRSDESRNPDRWGICNFIMAGTKREVAEYLHAMMVAIDDVTTTT